MKKITLLTSTFALLVASTCSSCAAEQKAITADNVEEHLRALGFQVPASGMKNQFGSVGGGVIDGVMSFGPIPRPFGAPKDDALASTQYEYESKQKDGTATIKAKIETSTGRFLFFASLDEGDTKAMRALLQRMDSALAEKQDVLAKEAVGRTGSNAPSATLRGVTVRVTEMGTVLASEKLPVVFGSEAPDTASLTMDVLR